MKSKKPSIKKHTTHFKIQLANDVDISEIDIELYSLSDNVPTLLATKKEASSTVTISYDIQSLQYAYAIARIKVAGGGGKRALSTNRKLALISVLKATEKTVVINELVTIATLYTYVKFISYEKGKEVIIASPKQQVALYKMKSNFVGAQGHLSAVIQSAPNGLQTNSLATLNFLANTLNQAILNNTIQQRFLRLTDTNSKSGSLLEAFHNLASNPFKNVKEIYHLTNQKKQSFTPSLTTLQLPHHISRIPNQWTLAIKVNDSGAKNFVIAGVGFLTFDNEDRAWVTNNVRAGTPNSSTFCTVLNSDGSPTSFSPVFGGGLLGGGFGITTNKAKDKIYLGNFGWGPTQCNPQEGSISVFSKDGQAESPPSGFTNKITRAQGMQFDSAGNLWICSWGSQAPLAPSSDTIYNFKSKNSGLVVYLNADPDNALFFEFDNPKYQPLDLVIDKDDNIMVANGGYKENMIKSSVFKFKLIDGEIKRTAIWQSNYVDHKDPADNGYESFKQINVDNKGEVLIAAMKSSRIIKLDRDLKYVREFTNTVDAAWGVCTDQAGTIFVANFGREEASKKDSPSLDMKKQFGVTVIKNEDDHDAKFMTLPSGGDEVLSANGEPLYGNNLNARGVHYKCYHPLMRMTATLPDSIGNLWCMNNWKPSAKVDTSNNPGGDGVVIFIGVTEPAGE